MVEIHNGDICFDIEVRVTARIKYEKNVQNLCDDEDSTDIADFFIKPNDIEPLVSRALRESSDIEYEILGIGPVKK